MAADLPSNSKWNVLPFPLLVEIFSLLSLRDRRNASITCKAWNNAFYSPFLWKSLHCKFNYLNSESAADTAFRNKMAFLVASHFGRWCVRLTVAILPPFEEEQEKMEMLHQNIQDFFKVLSTHENRPKLKALRIFDVFSDGHPELLEQETILVTTQFLRTQNALEVFVSEMNSTSLEGCLTLDAISQSAKTMRKLNVTGHFLYNVKRKGEIMFPYLKKFSKLESLYIKYEFLGAELLMSLAKTCQNTLKFIVISFYCYEEESFHKISPDVWYQIKLLVPELKVSIFIGASYSVPQLLKEVLPSTIPVANLNVTQMNSTRYIINYYWQSFHETLEAVTLRLLSQENSLFIEESIVAMVINSPKLHSLSYNSSLTFKTIEKLLKSKRMGTSGLENLAIRYLNFTPEDEELLLGVAKVYNYRMTSTFSIFGETSIHFHSIDRRNV